LKKSMRSLAIAICLCWLSLAASGQSEFGSLSGAIYTVDHAPIPNLAVEAKNAATGNIYKATSSPKGEYSFAQLSPGTYEISVLLVLYRPFLRKDFVIAAGQSQHLDIQLSGTLTGSTLGELPALFELFSKRPPPPKGPVPRMPDGRPDLSGVWMTPPFYLIAGFSQQPDLQPWAEAIVRERILNEVRDKPSARCLPDNESTEPFVGLLPVKIVHTRALLVALIEDVIAAHQVFLDGRSHPSDVEPTWMGHSIGKWDGDTLVIDTVGFNDKSWMFVVTPHTGMLHVITRLRRLDLGHLEIEATYDDPGTFNKPLKNTVVDVLAPDEELDEVVCDNNQYTEHVNAK
jgi:Carboxypeptidase regulatory-like domain